MAYFSGLKYPLSPSTSPSTRFRCLSTVQVQALTSLHYRLFSMHILCIFSTNLNLGIRTEDLHSMVHSRRPVVVRTKCPIPKPWPPLPPKLKVPEPPLRLVLALVMSRLDYCNSVVAGLPTSTLNVGYSRKSRTLQSDSSIS